MTSTPPWSISATRSPPSPIPRRCSRPGTDPPQRTRLLFWPRPEIPLAPERWPDLVQHADADAILAEREWDNRELVADGVSTITMVPLTVAALTKYAEQTGGDPQDERTRHGCMTEIFERDGAVTWPPPRNAPCWCQSRKKYKHCCGRAGSR